MSTKFLEILIFPMKQFNHLLKFIEKKAVKIEKRLRFALSSLCLALLLLFSTFFYFDKAFIFIPLLVVTTYVLTYFSVLEGIHDIEWFTLFFMPIVVSVSFYLFYFLFPVRWLTRLPFIVIYGISTYAILLTANIFNIGVEKSLQLYRAAFSVNFFYQTVCSFLLFNIILFFRLNFLYNAILAGGIGFLLDIHLFWTLKLDKTIEKRLLLFAFLIGSVIFEAASLMSFVPINSTIFSLFLTGILYSLSGLSYSYLDQRLFKETIREYLIVLGFIFVITLLSISW